MVELSDSENFEMPKDSDNDPVFSAEITVTHDFTNTDLPPKDVELTIKVPEYFAGITSEEKGFEYDSCVYLYVSLSDLIYDFVELYYYSFDTLDEAKFLLDRLNTDALYLAKWIEEKTCEEQSKVGG